MNRAPFLALSLCAAALTAPAYADEASLAPRQGVVLLVNGELITGTVIPAGDRYDIHLAAGEISVRRGDVAMVCADAQECYRRKRDTIELGRASEHLDLAEWCIRNGLLDEGARELEAAKVADAVHPKTRLIEARLAMARRPAPEESAPATPASRPRSMPSAKAPSASLPPAAMETFAHSIQPLLLNYCAKGGCHAGAGAKAMPLERMHPRRASRAATQRNLQQVLTLVDREQPSHSRLLQAPAQPHGGSGAVFTDRDKPQFAQLTAWVYEVCQMRAPQTPPSPTAESLDVPSAPSVAAEPSADGAQPATSVPHAEGADAPTEASDVPPAEPDAQAAEPSAAAPGYTPAQLRAMGLARQAASNVQYGARPAESFTPKDPFDPAIFNRRFFGAQARE
jgi:hypothetical protein